MIVKAELNMLYYSPYPAEAEHACGLAEVLRKVISEAARGPIPFTGTKKHKKILNEEI